MKYIRSSLVALGIIASAVLPIQASASTFSTDASWLAASSAPSGADWNSSLSFDTTGWVNAAVVDTSGGIDFLWHPDLVGSDPNDGYSWGQQVWFRTTIDLSAPFSSATFYGEADDDAKVYINGTLIINDSNNEWTQYPLMDITSYLHAGQNLVAVVATDTYCCGRAFGAQIEVTAAVPEPEIYAMMGLGLGLLGLVGRRRKQQVA